MFYRFVISVISVSQNFLTINAPRLFKCLKNYPFKSNFKDAQWNFHNFPRKI